MKKLIFEFQDSMDREDFIGWLEPQLKKFNEQNDPCDVSILDFIGTEYSDENFNADERIIQVKKL